MEESIRTLSSTFKETRDQTERLCAGLELEDLCLQGMCDTSPLKWHLAHTSWFFETFILKPFVKNYTPYHPGFEYLFNSYYNGIGKQYPRPQRSLLSRPTVKQVYEYRRQVTTQLLEILNSEQLLQNQAIYSRLILGINHEQQHQELMLTDLKYSFSLNPLSPCYNHDPLPQSAAANPLTYSEHAGGQVSIGRNHPEPKNSSYGSFSFDNEGPRHKVYLRPFAIANRLITNGEYIEFIEDGGYQTPCWWHADGWNTCQSESWLMPLYWRKEGDEYLHFTLHGEQPINDAHPVCHVSLYEAMAYSAWCGKRLCREDEWESIASEQPPEGNLFSPGLNHPTGHQSGGTIQQLFGDVWEWTQSAYSAYPGYQPATGALGEYNGKFMLNQMVLRGGSVATPPSHIRPTYRNFFYPRDRWQFSGIRLACDL